MQAQYGHAARQLLAAFRRQRMRPRGSLRKLRKQGVGAQFSFTAAIDAVPPCGCSSIFNAASRPLRRLAAALALQRMRPEEMNLTSVDPSGFGTRMRVASSSSTAPFMVP